ncbi:MAG TPA: LysM peptidoglycan-binding domain-containing protein, partial [Paracoccaceae bacterium]|nr:LysM peptidoglycan-binding domain-containing protein [Paracoccaceae bacterium]
SAEIAPVDENASDLEETMPGSEESASEAEDTGSATSEAAETAKAAAEEAETPSILEEAKDAVAAVQSNTESSQTADDGPTFDLVRVENDGSALIAGTAAPNSEVTILAEGVEIGKTTASSSGEFVAMVQTPPSDVGQSLQIAARSGAILTLSKETIIVLPVLKTVENAPEAPAIIKSTPDEIIIIQPTSVAYPDQVTLDLISYDDAGELQLAGRGTPDHDVRVYVDNRPAGRTTISSSGSWRVTLSGLQAGRYVLRLDELDGERVSSRFETPFQRAFPEEVREVMARGGGNYTVQPGNTLWYIATQYYGQGLRYHQIFGANQDKIRDPDLIYPGQVFDIPQMEIAE